VQPPPKQAPLTETLTEYMLPLAALAFIVMVAAAWMIRRGRRVDDGLPTLDEMMAQREVESKVGRKEDTEALPPMRAGVPEEGDEDLVPEADSSHYIFSVEEVDSLLEQAEVLLLFGEPAKAVGMIEEYLDGPGRDSRDPRPWLKLFQLLRSDERRTEFEQRAEMFKRRYNIEKPNWMMYTPEGMYESGTGLEEGCPHILQRIEELWSQPSDVVDYLEALLLDDRDGAREGFPQLIAEDLLTLRDLARERAEA
jgi:hypothetical protein